MLSVQRDTRDLLQSLFIMASMVEARDPYTGGHLWRVSQFARLLAQDAGLPADTVARISLGGFLHDLGKISVPDAILNKRDHLTGNEYQVVKTHPDVGARLLSNHPLAGLVTPAILCHHERPDGLGYPAQLEGDSIKVDARIVALCDAFDAMTSTRPYRRGMPVEKALDIIDGLLGKQFDATLGERFIALGRKGDLDGVVGHSEPGIPVQDCPICGPTIVVMHKHETGDSVFCRACGGEAIVQRHGDVVEVQHTGRQGTPTELEPELDTMLIENLVHVSARYLKTDERTQADS